MRAMWKYISDGPGRRPERYSLLNRIVQTTSVTDPDIGKCESCGFDNRADASYCGNCGQFLGRCPACGAENPAGHRFCDVCGEGLQPQGREGAPTQKGLILRAPRRAARSISVALQAARNNLRAIFGPVRRFLSNPPAGNRFLGVGAGLSVIGQIGLSSSASDGQASGYAVAILHLGAALFAVGSARSRLGHNSWSVDSATLSIRALLGSKAARFFLIAAVILFAGLIQALVIGADLGWYVFPWLASMVAVAAVFILPGRPRQDSKRRSRIAEIAFVAAVMATFVALNARDLTDWYYSVIGDEYAFYNEARSQLENGVFRPFDQAGVYGKHPVLGTTYQALVMAVLGSAHFGWKMSSVIAIAISIPGVYVIGRHLGGRGVGALATSIFASSHYLFAYAHTGYNNIHALAPSVWALALLVHGVRKQSALSLYASGVLAGLGFYTFFSARATIAIIVIFLLSQGSLRRAITSLRPIAIGFIIAAAPMFVVSRMDTISMMITEVPGGYSTTVSGPALERMAENVTRNLLAFNFNADAHHYVTGSLLDPLTAVLAVLGAGLAIRHIRRSAFRLLLIWIGVGAVVTGVLSPYPGVAISRLNFLIPPLAVLAAFALVEAWRAARFRPGIFSLRWSGPAAAIVVAIAILGLNYNRFWTVSPGEFHLSQQAIGVGAARSEACSRGATGAIFVGSGIENPLKFALQSFAGSDGVESQISDYPALASVLESHGSPECVIFVSPGDQSATNTQRWLIDRYPAGQLIPFTDRAQKGRVVIFEIIES